MKCESIVLAAGLGTRMKSKLPKVLHPLGGKPMIWWVAKAVQSATGLNPNVVIGPGDAEVEAFLGSSANIVFQEERLGTAHAVLQAREKLLGTSDFVLVVNGDMPLLRAETLTAMMTAQTDNRGPLTILTGKPSHSRGFGRVIRDAQGAIGGIIEEAHASYDELKMVEVNVGAYCFRASWLWDTLPNLPVSPKGEYYITDMVGRAVAEGGQVGSVEIEDEDEIIGINTREHLAEAQAAVQRRINSQVMASGVTIMDPATTYIDAMVVVGMDTTILPNTHLQGETRIGENCEIGPNSMIRDSSIGHQCKVLMSMVTWAVLEDNVDVGPFARLRPGAYLCTGVHVGNFGEIKQSRLGPGVRMGHFSYIGDATIGENTNIGAGTITCNFDGVSKHETIIGKDVFIGSDTMLVAPVTLGDGSRTGAGSVVTKDVPENTLVAGIPARAIRKLA